MPMPLFTPASPSAAEEPPPDPAWAGWRGPILLGLIIFCCALVGILSRPINYASALWPANPVLAGLMVRHAAQLRRPAGWIGAFIGFLAADLMTGSSWLATLWFTAANIAGAWVGSWVLLHTSYATRSMQGQNSALALFAAALCSALTAASAGAGTGPVLFQSELWPNIAMWISGELLSYSLILPVLLAFPRHRPRRLSDWMEWDTATPLWQRLAPLAAVAVALGAALSIGGPGTLSFVVPALLWCALSFSFLVTGVLCMAVCLVLTVEVAMGSFQFTPEFWLSTLSLRVGITLLALGPLAVASNRIARKQAIERLDHTINHDFLTGLLSRNAFFQRAQQQLGQLRPLQAPVAVLVMDLDHFKQINDRLGHASGDDVLRQFAHVAASHMRAADLLGRMGGEEFLVLLPELSYAQAQAVAEQVRQAVAAHPFVVAGQTQPLHVSVSIGLVHCTVAPMATEIDALIHSADILLYQAKQEGRNRVVGMPYGQAMATAQVSHHALHRRHAPGSR
ncbi:MAG: diguanylate cyclase [Comamonas sp.]